MVLCVVLNMCASRQARKRSVEDVLKECQSSFTKFVKESDGEDSGGGSDAEVMDRCVAHKTSTSLFVQCDDLFRIVLRDHIILSLFVWVGFSRRLSFDIQ
jgi:hypothetical protein